MITGMGGNPGVAAMTAGVVSCYRAAEGQAEGQGARSEEEGRGERVALCTLMGHQNHYTVLVKFHMCVFTSVVGCGQWETSTALQMPSP